MTPLAFMTPSSSTPTITTITTTSTTTTTTTTTNNNNNKTTLRNKASLRRGCSTTASARRRMMNQHYNRRRRRASDATLTSGSCGTGECMFESFEQAAEFLQQFHAFASLTSSSSSSCPHRRSQSLDVIMEHSETGDDDNYDDDDNDDDDMKFSNVNIIHSSSVPLRKSQTLSSLMMMSTSLSGTRQVSCLVPNKHVSNNSMSTYSPSTSSSTRSLENVSTLLVQQSPNIVEDEWGFYDEDDDANDKNT